jgi:hypothetical protein
VRVRVTVQRGTPLPWPVALLFTVIGAALVVVGFTVVGKIEAPGGSGFGSFIDIVGLLLIVVSWAFYIRVHTKLRRIRRAARVDAPRELAEPPGDGDPAVVGALVGEGKVPARAVAATILGLCDRGVVDVYESGERVVLELPDSQQRGDDLSPTDALVLDALRLEADRDGKLAGPPIWRVETDWWWGDYVRSARSRAVADGLVEPRIPLVGLMLVGIFTATGLALIFFWYIAAFVGLILLANGLPHLIARASGYRLSIEGVAARARWIAFGRYLHEQGSLREVGPGGVAIWGPYLVYGVLLGEAERAATVLTPDVEDHHETPSEPAESYTVEL